jgi:adenylyltransferase/sulfurtransferase
MLLPGWGPEGQRRLAASTAVIVGCGALGCASADLLARAGVGALILIDRDLVEPTNLQRQTLYAEADLDWPKAEAAARRLRSINSEITIQPRVADLSAASVGSVAPELLAPAGPTIIIDGTDNTPTRYLLNDLAVRAGLAYAYAGVVATHGLQATFTPVDGGACLRCVFEEPPSPGSLPTCDTAGVLGPAVAIVAGAQAADALKILLGRHDLLSRSLLEFDLWANRRTRLDLASARREDCPCCGQRRFEFLSGERSEGPVVLCGQNAVQIAPAPGSRVDLVSLASAWAPLGDVKSSPWLIKFAPAGSALSLTLFRDGRTIVHGTDKPDAARAFHARFVGA